MKLSWFSEETEAYTDSLNNTISPVKTELGTLDFGPSFSTELDVGNGITLTPFGTVKGIWTIASEERVTPAATPANASDEGVRVRVEAGFDLNGQGGFSLSASGSYDGIDDRGYEAIGLQIGIRKTW